MEHKNIDLDSIQYFDKEEENEIREIEMAWTHNNKFPNVEEERLLVKLKEAALKVLIL